MRGAAPGSGQKNLTNHRATLNDSPAWSPDSMKIAFVSNRYGVEDIHVMNADGSNPRESRDLHPEDCAAIKTRNVEW
jgi:Tol biopolymer transport system component